MSGHRCGMTVEAGNSREPGRACGKPASWYLEDVGHAGDDLWMCERHTRETLLMGEGTCDGVHVDEDGVLRRSA